MDDHNDARSYEDWMNAEASFDPISQQDAIDEMVAAYVSVFGEEPDNVTGMVIRTSVQRVLEGDPYRWFQDGPWRKLEWSRNGFDE